MKEKRKLSISYSFDQGRKQNKVIPLIRLRGKWLQELGFKQGEKVIVETSAKKLVIKLLE